MAFHAMPADDLACPNNGLLICGLSSTACRRIRRVPGLCILHQNADHSNCLAMIPGNRKRPLSGCCPPATIKQRRDEPLPFHSQKVAPFGRIFRSRIWHRLHKHASIVLIKQMWLEMRSASWFCRPCPR